MKRFLMTAMSAIMALSLMACTDTGKEDEKKVSEGFIITDQAGRKVNFMISLQRRRSADIISQRVR